MKIPAGKKGLHLQHHACFNGLLLPTARPSLSSRLPVAFPAAQAHVLHKNVNKDLRSTVNIGFWIGVEEQTLS